MAMDLNTRIIEEINALHQYHWKYQWASDMPPADEEEPAGEEEAGFRNDWDEWFWNIGG